jgi:GGDEF domain-containing protein
MNNPSLSPALAASVLRDLPVGIAILDDAAEVVWTNPALAFYLGKAEDELPEVVAALHDAKLETGSVGRLDQVEGQDGRLRKLLYSISALDDGQRVLSLVDISAAKRGKFATLRRGLLNVATRVDPGTGALARDSIFQELVAQVSRSRRYDNPLTVILMRVLDAANSQVEDPVASRAIAQALKQRLRWVDSVGVWDDGQFLLLLPETTADAAAALATEICAQLRDLAVKGGEQPLQAFYALSAWEKGDEALALVDRLNESMREQLKEQTAAVG